jgi:hypothetical protein
MYPPTAIVQAEAARSKPPGYQYFKRIDLQKDRPHVSPLQPITFTLVLHPTYDVMRTFGLECSCTSQDGQTYCSNLETVSLTRCVGVHGS